MSIPAFFHRSLELSTSPTARPQPAAGAASADALFARALDAAGLALLGMVLAWFVAANQRLQWDLRTYLHAGSAVLAGLDPYRIESLSQVAGRLWHLPFVYPPVTLFVFAPLATLPLGVAAAIWMALKVASLVVLALVWKRVFRLEAGPFALALVLLLGFDGSALWDLRTGNVALLEAALLWGGLACWAAGRRAAFTTLVVAASLFKLAPIAFLILLLIPSGGRRARPDLFALGVAAFVILVIAPAAMGTGAGWFSHAGAALEPRPMGPDNPGALATLDGLIGSQSAAGFDLPVAGWLCYALLVAGSGLAVLKRGWRSRPPRDWVLATVPLWLLLHPRPMCYGYVAAIGAVMGLAPRPFSGRAGALALAALLSMQGLLRLLHQQPAGVVFEQMPFWMLLGVWLLWLGERSGDRSEAGVPFAPTTAAGVAKR